MNGTSKKSTLFIKWSVHLGGPSAAGRENVYAFFCVTARANEDGVAKCELG